MLCSNVLINFINIIIIKIMLLKNKLWLPAFGKLNDINKAYSIHRFGQLTQHFCKSLVRSTGEDCPCRS